MLQPDQLDKVLRSLRSQRVEQFDGFGVSVKFAFTAYLPERERAKKESPIVDKKLAALQQALGGSIDLALAERAIEDIG